MVSLVGGGGDGRISRANYEGNPAVFTFNSAGVATDRDFDVVLFLPEP